MLTIAIADAFSDALGIHISEEAENVHTTTEVWTATGATFLTKLLLALTFLVPVLLFSLPAAIGVAVVWGLSMLAVLLSYRLARAQRTRSWKVIAIVVITLTHWLGDWVAISFK